MSETAKKLFESLKTVKDAVNTALPGLKNILSDTKAELSRQAEHGAMELASGLCNGQAFVLYGWGQHPRTSEQEQGAQEKGHEQEREMER